MTDIHGIAEWAIQKACRLSGWRDWSQLKRSHPGPKAKLPQAVTALAKYVEAHDAPPVDEFEDFHAAISASATAGFQNRDYNRALFEALCQLLASRIEARSDATGTGAAVGESLIGDSRDAQPTSSQSSIDYRGERG